MWVQIKIPAQVNVQAFLEGVVINDMEGKVKKKLHQQENCYT